MSSDFIELLMKSSKVSDSEKWDAEYETLPVVIAEDPLTCVVMGTGRCLDEMKSLRNVLIGA